MTGITLSFLRPGWLLLLPLLGLVVWAFWHKQRTEITVWQRLVDAHLLAQLLVRPDCQTRRLGVALLASGLLLSVIALAGPALDASPNTQRRDVLRLLVLDLSPRMAAPLAQVKLKLQALLKALPPGQTALLVYGGAAYLVVPPTSDVETIGRFVPELALDVLPVPGNRPELALLMARELFGRSTAQQRELVWITADGSAAPPGLAELAGVRLFILQATGDLAPAWVRAAGQSGGVALSLRGDDGDIRQLVSQLAVGEGWAAGAGGNGVAQDLGYWLVLPLLLLAALAFRRGILLAGLAWVLVGGLMPPPVFAQSVSVTAMLANYQAWRLLQAGQFEAAAARFADPSWRAVAQYRAGQFGLAAISLANGSDADAYYNRGNALAQQGQLTDALAAYEQSLKLRSGDADTRHNRDLVQRLLNPPPPEAPQGSGGRSPAPTGKNPSAGAVAPSTPGAEQPQLPGGVAEHEADRVAEQWLRRIPDQPGNLLRRKLLAEELRRQSAAPARP